MVFCRIFNISLHRVACFFWRRQRLWIYNKKPTGFDRLPTQFRDFCLHFATEWELTSLACIIISLMRMDLLFVILENDVWNLLYQRFQNSMKRKYLVISCAILPSLFTLCLVVKMHQYNIWIPSISYKSKHK